MDTVRHHDEKGLIVLLGKVANLMLIEISSSLLNNLLSFSIYNLTRAEVVLQVSIM